MHFLCVEHFFGTGVLEPGHPAPAGHHFRGAGEDAIRKVVRLLVIDEVAFMPGHSSAAPRLDILDGRSIPEGVEVLKVMNNLCDVFAVLC
jgi:hypothetical protein